MKKILEHELSKDSFFDKSYLLSRLERENAENDPLYGSYSENAGVRFVLSANFHDAKIIDIIYTEYYGKPCIVMHIDFGGSATEFKKGYKKFELYFIDAEYIEKPEKSRNLHIIDFDCVLDREKPMINIKSVYFIGAQEHIETCKIMCARIDVKPFDRI